MQSSPSRARAPKYQKLTHQMGHAGCINVFLAVGQNPSDGGLRFTYDQWRQSLLNNKFVRLLKGLQFGMLDADNDGEVSLGDISRAIFRRASDRDQARICRFLEVRTYDFLRHRKSEGQMGSPGARVLNIRLADYAGRRSVSAVIGRLPFFGGVGGSKSTQQSQRRQHGSC